MMHPLPLRARCLLTVAAASIGCTLTACSFYPSNKSVGVPFCAAGEGEIYELAVYRFGSAGNTAIADARRDLRAILGRYPGFRCALPLTGIDEAGLGADLIVWRSIDDARSAQRDAANDARLAPLREGIEKVEITGFFDEIRKPGTPTPAPTPPTVR